MSDIVQKTIAQMQKGVARKEWERKIEETFHRNYRAAKVIQGDLEITVQLRGGAYSHGKWAIDVDVYKNNPEGSKRCSKYFWTLKSATRYFERIVRDYSMKED